MPTIVGILTSISRINFSLSRVEHEKTFITSLLQLEIECAGRLAMTLFYHVLKKFSGGELHYFVLPEMNISQQEIRKKF